MNPRLLLLIVPAMALLSNCSEPPADVNCQHLEEREGVWYLPSNPEPYKGQCTVHHPNGQVAFERTYDRGLENGMQKEFFESGNLRAQGAMVDGRLNGPFTEWYDNGQVHFEITWKDGLQSGKLSEFYEDGSKKMEAQFEAGIPVGTQTIWYSNGQAEKATSFEKGLEHGPFETWHENGNSRMKGQVMAGKESGQWQEWWEDGTLRSVSNWNAGVPVDSALEYSEQGALIRLMVFDSGQVAETHHYDPLSGQEVAAAAQ